MPRDTDAARNAGAAHPLPLHSGPMDPEYVLNKSLPYLTSKLEDAGLTVQLCFDKTRGTMFLLLNDSVKCGINELINELLDAEPDAHHDLMDSWVPYLIERTRIGETILNKPDELRRLIRTEFCTGDVTAHPQFSYARQYPGGLAHRGYITRRAGTHRCPPCARTSLRRSQR